MKKSILVTCSLAFPAIIILSVIYQDSIFYFGFGKVKIFTGNPQTFAESSSGKDQNASISGFGKYQNASISGFGEDQNAALFGFGYDTESCLSRKQSSAYRKSLVHKPSSYFLSKLRNYETLHKNCGPYTKPYNESLKSIQSFNISNSTDCNYIVWAPIEGLGNRIVSMTSAFFYALLTNRTLLVHFGPDMANLFCEPFPNTSWLLPQDFPLNPQVKKFTQKSITFQNLMENSTELPVLPVVYVYLAAGKDKLFYCEEEQKVLRKVPWLILKSDEYFIPSFFLIPSFKEELDMMFPDKEMVFHFLSRYLFNPSNKAWGLITRFYEAYLAKSDQRIGMQIRVFYPEITSLKNLTDQILACSQQKNLLSRVDEKESIPFSSKNGTPSKSILITSLYSEFYEEFKNEYWQFPTISGEVIGVYQLSYEGYQHYGDSMHNMKAWVEMNLLSFCDVLITSAMSTFGYVAQGLGGLKPWILERPWNYTMQNQACILAMSIEPCFHSPPLYDCMTKVIVDMGTIVPHVKHCEDMPNGMKLFNM